MAFSHSTTLSFLSFRLPRRAVGAKPTCPGVPWRNLQFSSLASTADERETANRSGLPRKFGEPEWGSADSSTARRDRSASLPRHAGAGGMTKGEGSGMGKGRCRRRRQLQWEKAVDRRRERLFHRLPPPRDNFDFGRQCSRLTRFVGEDAGLQAADYCFRDQAFDGAA